MVYNQRMTIQVPEALIQMLREAGDFDRNYDGSGPGTFCHEAADLIEELAAQLAESEEKHRICEDDKIEAWHDSDRFQALFTESEKVNAMLQARIDADNRRHLRIIEELMEEVEKS